MNKPCHKRGKSHPIKEVWGFSGGSDGKDSAFTIPELGRSPGEGNGNHSIFLIPACASSSPAFLTMHSAYKLNKQGDNIQP